MKLEDIQAEIEADSEINNTNLDHESLRIPQLHSKYYKMYLTEVRILKGIESDFRRKKLDCVLYYTGQATDDKYKERPLHKKVLKQEVDLFLDADVELSELKNKYEMQKLKAEMLEAFIKTLNTRNFLIKNAIDWIKFKNGT